MPLPRPPRRRSTPRVAAVFTAATLIAGPIPALAAPTAHGGDTAKVDAQLAGALSHGGVASFFVVLQDQADLSGAKKQKTHAARARAAFKELRATAEDTQSSLTSFLDKKKVGHQDYRIAHTVQVTGDHKLVNELAKRPDVASIVKEQHYKLDDTETAYSKVTTARTGSSATGDSTPE
ncbi:hypothetical protein OKJ48_01220 [Streptomyces kunmingensis]|uniref:Inhibitor I9 domain-containing protein n=1 Tax=Streptomyces kunmingensis TaxID=68225 RepID=A0ABU6C2K9_9ACTN|nr:hypothetical protein [Streptomyces kunmingensis]